MNAESFRTLPLQPRDRSEGGAEFDVAGHGRVDSATTLISTPALVRASEPHRSGSVGSDIAPPPLLQALPRLAARLQARHPAASPAMVQSCIEVAVRSFDTARVRLYLPILVERSASDSLRYATHSSDRVDTPERSPI
jgi:hypothetical protein